MQKAEQRTGVIFSHAPRLRLLVSPPQSRHSTLNSFLAGLVGEVLQILFDESAVFLRIFFGLGLLNRSAIALRQTCVLAGTSRGSAGSIGAARSVPISLPAISV